MAKTNDNKFVGTSLKRWRTQSHDLTQQALADYLGVSYVTISKWESNLLKCSHPKILAMALAHFDCPR